MEKEKFEREMLRARTLGRHGRNPEYWAGYQRGLRRNYHGENFGTEEEHDLWFKMADSPDKGRAERGRGYRDGLQGEAIL